MPCPALWVRGCSPRLEGSALVLRRGARAGLSAMGCAQARELLQIDAELTEAVRVVDLHKVLEVHCAGVSASLTRSARPWSVSPLRWTKPRRRSVATTRFS